MTKPERDGKSFRLLVRAVDLAGNTQSNFSLGVSSLTFYMDVTKPVTTVSKPVQSQAYKPSNISGGSAFTGVSIDGPTPGASGINAAQVVLFYLNLSDNSTYYWTGTQFSSQTTETASWIDATPANVYPSSTTWNFLFANASDWTSQGDQQYRMKARGRDNTIIPPSVAGQGNLEDVFGSGNQIDFIVDNTAPQVRIVVPSNGGYVSNLTQITGTANADKAGLETSSNNGIL